MKCKNCSFCRCFKDQFGFDDYYYDFKDDFTDENKYCKNYILLFNNYRNYSEIDNE